jgi:hypothetical protein
MKRASDWVPGTIDLTVPSLARIYDYYLGGAHNFEVDRALARQMIALVPELPAVMQANRAFLHRAIRHLVRAGITQFIDIGSGIPTEGNVHETAQRENPYARVLYVDRDPVAVLHGELMIRDNPGARMLRADLRQPREILESVARRELIDLDRPVAVLMAAVLHTIAEEEKPEQLLAAFAEAVVPGSYLVLSDVSPETVPLATLTGASRLFDPWTDALVYRDRSRLIELLDGWEMAEPGMVWLPQWRPVWPDDVGPDPASTGMLAVVAAKPGPRPDVGERGV